MTSKRISPQSAKDKGRRLQHWVCHKIAELTGYPWGTSGDDQPIESRPMGQPGPDVRMESQVLEQFPFTVECKSYEKWAVPEWIEQAKRNCMDGTHWLLIAKRSRKPPVVMMDADTFFALMERKGEE